nr:MAG TPA: hypothetical protein [Caudoviricetes sp.]
MLSPPYLWLHVGGIGVLFGGLYSHHVHIDLSGCTGLTGTIGIDDDSGLTLFALAGQQGIENVGNNNFLANAELDLVAGNEILEFIADVLVTGHVECALSGGFGGCLACTDVGLILRLRVQLGVHAGNANLGNHIVTDFTARSIGNINCQNAIIVGDDTLIGCRRGFARHEFRNSHVFLLSIGKIVHSHQNLMIFGVIVVPGEHCRPGVAGNFSCLFPIPQIRQWAAGYGPVTNSIQDFISFQPVVVAGWLQAVDDFELILPLIRPANVFLGFVGPLDSRKCHTRLIGRKVFKGDIGGFTFILIQPNQQFPGNLIGFCLGYHA